MNPIEHEVREMLRTKVAQAPVRDEPPPVVLRRARVMRGVNGLTAVAASAAVVLAIVLGAQALGDRQPVDHLGPVPWVPEPAEDPVRPDPKPCRSEDVASVQELIRAILFFPRDLGVSCTIDPAQDLTIAVRDSAGSTLPVSVVVADSTPWIWVQGWETVVASFDFGWSSYCGPSREDVFFDIGLGGNSEVLRAPISAAVIPECRPGERSTITLQAGGAIAPSYGGRGGLPLPYDVSIQGPPTARRGETYTFIVSVQNRLDEPLELSSCPEYAVQLIGNLTESDVGSGTLNCAGVAGRAVPALGRVDFEMQVEIPAGLEPGEWTLRWYLAPGGREPATIAIRVS